MCLLLPTSGLYYKPMMIVYDNSWVITKVETSLTDNASHHLRSSHVYSTGQSTDVLPENSLVVTINWCLILLNSTGLFLDFVNYILLNPILSLF